MSKYYDECSATLEALSTIYEMRQEESSIHESYIYTGYLIESGAYPEIVQESVSDTIHRIVEAIKKFISRVKEFFKKIILFITTAFADLDKVADEVKDYIKDKNFNFEISGYEFTVINKQGPNTREFDNIVADYNSDIQDLSKLKTSEFKQKFDDWFSENNLDKLRGEVLGVNESIDEDTFKDEVRKYYRNGEKNAKNIKVTNKYVNDIISHAKKLEDLKESSIKDRDKLISLLSKTETFFDRGLTVYYKGNQKTTNLKNISTSNGVYSTTDNEIIADDDVMNKLNKYVAYKYKQVNKIAAMINLVASERINALKDQISQERSILRKCLFGAESDTNKVKESSLIDGESYDIMAMESCIRDINYYDRERDMRYLQEANFIMESLKTGFIPNPVMELNTNTLGGKIVSTLHSMFDKLFRMYLEKAKGNVEKYKPWIAEITSADNKLEEKAKEYEEFPISDYFNCDYKKIMSDMSNAVKQAYTTNDYKSASWAKSIYNKLDSLESLKNTDNREEITNYFRTGKVGEKLSTITLNGEQLSGKIKEMTEYVSNYDSIVETPMKNIEKSITDYSGKIKASGSTPPDKNASQTAQTNSEQKEKPVNDAFLPTTYLYLLGCRVCESDLTLCRNYRSVFGEVVTEQNEGNTGLGEAQKMAKNAPGKENSGSDKKDDAGENKDGVSSPTAVGDAKKKEGAEGGESNPDAVAYKKTVDAFFKHTISWMLTARDQQFLSYVKALAKIDGQSPKFDEKGKYIPKAKANENKESDKESKDEH